MGADQKAVVPVVALSRHWRVIVPAKPGRHAPAVSPYNTAPNDALNAVSAAHVTAAPTPHPTVVRAHPWDVLWGRVRWGGARTLAIGDGRCPHAKLAGGSGPHARTGGEPGQAERARGSGSVGSRQNHLGRVEEEAGRHIARAHDRYAHPSRSVSCKQKVRVRCRATLRAQARPVPK
jgi:hypothetical protein